MTSSPDGRTAIVLSAGYFGFFAHAGFMLAVEEAGIDYCAVAGSSAGAIVAALHASGVPAAEIVNVLLGLRRGDVWDRTGIMAVARALLRRGRGWTGWLKGDLFETMIERHLRVKTFEECPRALYITALNLTQGCDETFYSGRIADKVRASCSYPFLLSPKVIDDSTYWDGGFLSKIPFEEMVGRERPGRLIIHYLPAREGQVGVPQPQAAGADWSAVKLLEKAITAARKEIEVHRLRALDRLRDRITWVEPAVPPVSPNHLEAGRDAVEAAYRYAKSALLPLTPP